ncbi:hypothetical protein E3Q22_01745 [Wallemia mellicola]|uniref:ATP phosphoribosyltransferase n=2 Tax=Wallemia mellicola TaxID=1708541 RepID=A0A4T0NBC5_9BASI|nr:hypothetical protein WALSEDRAFT_36069 [Wallemia mellicola CBS 633.66]TIB72099.1 hypothetical protein E3Q24_01906 [Wallemia mellicola]EIM22854.1 hypothetical protein WALSEDRAFT_36069 [Wallemia mellicola CBS 633.66]TIB77031.1 hypothetical protein E3Q23_01532 [Wallemia mellicola]TIB80687.1 hypothetical protein E3Q22_01745 [Wallemia mellicola]TIB85669.1 hypothetical protein E3Q21_01929 [Wallemia mellicola]|eukprot:XP_006956904.1 hypothetical protein WALSEDRAFT_36069 [Wallemia mellicola CBS 633.66]
MSYKLIFYCPIKNTSNVLRGIFDKTTAGGIGNYTECYFKTKGVGSFKPSSEANPHIGEANKAEYVEEDKVELLTGGVDNTKKTVEVLKSVHPYEEVAYEVYRIEDF